jgi:hypothetical protein
MMIGIRRAPGAQAPGEAGGAGQDAGRP